MVSQIHANQAFDFSAPPLLFEAKEAGSAYAVSADGQRFLINPTIRETTLAPISIVFEGGRLGAGWKYGRRNGAFRV